MIETKEIAISEKIPIEIGGYRSFFVVAGEVEELRCGTFCGEGYGQDLEKGIESAIENLVINAKVYLNRMVKGMENGEYEDLAFKIVTHKGKAEDLFFLTYERCWEEKVEPQLGKFRSLEAVVR